jgi:uncharacterized protein
MFLLAYLVPLLLAAAPLGVSLLQASAGQPVPPHRIYRDLLYLGIVVLAIIGFETGFRIALQNYWFGELGQQYRYWLALGLRTGIFAVVLLVVGVFAGLNLQALGRALPAVPGSAPWAAGFAFAAIVGYGATGLWMPLLAWLGATDSGMHDPVFGKDLSFFLLALPFYDGLLSLVLTVLGITLALWAVVGLLFYNRWGRNWPFGDRWQRQGAALAVTLCLASAAGRVLGRYHLVIDGHSPVVAGAGYVDIRFWLPAYDTIIAGWLIAALVFAAAAVSGRWRRWLLAARSHWAPPAAAFASLFVSAGIIPATVERLYVDPNQITLEQPYLVRSIEGTRRAFNLTGPDVTEEPFAVSAKPLSAADLEANAATLQDARIWDWRALEPQLQQIQGLRPYYTFAGVDIDRYRVDGAERQVMITARELDVSKLPEAARVWVNLALKYTHGYGVVAVPVNEMDGRGNPVLWAHDIPVEAKPDLTVKHGEIYYGNLTRDRVYVHTTEKEFDFPRGDANAETIYQGSGGIALSNVWRKLVIAHEFDGLRLFISGYFTKDSRVLIRRNVVERVERLAPFLTFDRDPYIVADRDHYSWIIDAYTSSANYPYSEAYEGSRRHLRGQNYLRNSVKAVVDAYDGSVTFYVFDKSDPIIRAYWKMLPGLFRDQSEMPANLRRHIRYPEDLFLAQAEMYGTYHMTNPVTFYNREDRWEVPRELYRNYEIEMMPYYVLAQLPGAAKPEFLLMLPLSVYGKNQMAGWLAGLCDGDDYGKLVAFRFPKGRFVDGPAQIESRINSDSRFSGDLTLWDQHGSLVIRGNLIALPLHGNQLIAIEPVYIEAEQTRIPTLARVVLAQLLPDDRRIEWAPTLRDVEALFTGAPVAAPALAAGKPPEGADRLEQARAVFKQMQQEYAAGNFVHYGELLQQLGRILLPQQ